VTAGDEAGVVRLVKAHPLSVSLKPRRFDCTQARVTRFGAPKRRSIAQFGGGSRVRPDDRAGKEEETELKKLSDNFGC
jgi:hypothetical protein